MEVDVEPDFDASMAAKWAICKVGRDEFDKLLEWEKKVITRINKAEKRKKREELKDALTADIGEEFTAIPDFSTEATETTKKED